MTQEQERFRISQVATEASEWKRAQKRTIGWAEAVGHVLSQEGRQTLQEILTRSGERQIPTEIEYYLRSLDRYAVTRFKRALAQVFVGVLAESLEKGVFNGWSTPEFIDKINTKLSGLPIPSIHLPKKELDSEKIRKMDSGLTAFITRVLVQTRDLSFFFKEPKVFAELTPVIELLEAWNNIFTAEVLREGSFVQEYINLAKTLQ